MVTYAGGSALVASGSEAAAGRRARGSEVTNNSVVEPTDEMESDGVTLGGSDGVGCEGQTACADLDIEVGGIGHRSKRQYKVLEHVDAEGCRAGLVFLTSWLREAVAEQV